MAHPGIIRCEGSQLEEIAPVAVEAVLAVDKLGVSHVLLPVALQQVTESVLIAQARVVCVLRGGQLLHQHLPGHLRALEKSEYLYPFENIWTV